jgi:hypothetical protein
VIFATLSSCIGMLLQAVARLEVQSATVGLDPRNLMLASAALSLTARWLRPSPTRASANNVLRSHGRARPLAFPVDQPGNDDSYWLYGTWPVELAAIACATLDGIGVHRAGIFAARLGFSV